ncbi:MAG: nucleoside diphosphate kinase regulator [Rhizobiales bacterium]|nr:nucleoside diphosphate kinase regulator [Hyphomicrobiales bacterium]MBN9010424.1 nucleoside diphosphate kinase regulator [Hyphomicrobiales bacterium]
MTQIHQTKPQIVLSDADYDRLANLAATAAERLPDLAGELQSELDRAQVVAIGAVPSHVVRMGSTVEFRAEGGMHRTVTLVFPGEADIASNRVSVLTPIGTALIGLAKGQSIRWRTRDGREQELTIIDVTPPAFGASPEQLLS